MQHGLKQKKLEEQYDILFFNTLECNSFPTPVVIDKWQCRSSIQQKEAENPVLCITNGTDCSKSEMTSSQFIC